jgi:alpha-1,3/alpha-1,6-mannosyltransferase
MTRHHHHRKKKIIFIHLDLGIGGAEQLVLNLAAASQDAGHEVTIVTSRCSQSHCFSQVKKPDGRLCTHVRVWGKFLPTNVLGVGTALCSSIRMLYLSYWTAKRFGRTADCIVLDVLPTAIPFLTTWVKSGILYYCHFPDKLLTRDTVNGEATDEALQQRSSLRTWYRNWMDGVEENTMSYADVLCVNSKFTLTQVQKVFSSLTNKDMRVLCPALDMEKFDQPHFTTPSKDAPIVSLNRFERKKNIELLLRAYALLQKEIKKNVPPLIIAGGYDIRNVENVEYLQELKKLAAELSIQTVKFRPSVSDEERAKLMQTALCIVYTPHLEHFGIVPLESMYAGRPVIAVKSGGPMETVVDGKTGFLCDKTPKAFCEALTKLVKNPALSTTLGKAGHEHVKLKFGLERFQKHWAQLVDDTIEAGKVRRMNQRGGYMVWRSFYYIADALLTFGGALVLTFILRWTGVLEPDQHILGKLRSLREDWDDGL